MTPVGKMGVVVRRKRFLLAIFLLVVLSSNVACDQNMDIGRVNMNAAYP